MPLQDVIREKRRELGLTQEQIAGALGVSAPAVSKWEAGQNCPDIALLPALARLLKTDVNALLCFREEMTDEEINAFLTELDAAIRRDGFACGYDKAMGAVREYPHCAKLIYSIALALEGSMMLTGVSQAERSRYEPELFALYERVAREGEGQTRDGAAFMLTGKYMARGEYEKAESMLALLPKRSALDEKQLRAKLLMEEGKTAEAAELLEQKLLSAVQEVQQTLLAQVDVALKEEDLPRAEQISARIAGVVKSFELWPYNACVAPMEIAFAKKDVEESLTAVRMLLSEVVQPWRAENTSLYRRCFEGMHRKYPKKKEQSEKENFGIRLLPSLLAEMETSEQTAFLRKDERFEKLLAFYRSSCPAAHEEHIKT